MAEKLFYSMGEVSEMFDVNASLIRHWESQFSVLRPKRNKKGNRMFTPEDVENLKLIYHLVKEQGMTLEGAKKALRQRRRDPGVARDMELLERLQRVRALLEEVREDLKTTDGEVFVADDTAADPVVGGSGRAVMAGAAGADKMNSGGTTPGASEADAAASDAVAPDAAAPQTTGAKPARRAKAVVKIADENPGGEAVDGDSADAPKNPKKEKAARRPRRKKGEGEEKELFAFYEQSLF